jgi:hypothetical protein
VKHERLHRAADAAIVALGLIAWAVIYLTPITP